MECVMCGEKIEKSASIVLTLCKTCAVRHNQGIWF